MKKKLWMFSVLLAACVMVSCGVKNDVESNSGLHPDLENNITTEGGEDGGSESGSGNSASSDSTSDNENGNWADIEFPRP